MVRFVEVMAPVFSRKSWNCVWQMIQVFILTIELLYFNLITTLKFISPKFTKKFILFFQNDLVHGWGLDFAFWRCVEVQSSPFYVVPINRFLIIMNTRLNINT